jgi:hypothetical protein
MSDPPKIHPTTPPHDDPKLKHIGGCHDAQLIKNTKATHPVQARWNGTMTMCTECAHAAWALTHRWWLNDTTQHVKWVKRSITNTVNYRYYCRSPTPCLFGDTTLTGTSYTEDLFVKISWRHAVKELEWPNHKRKHIHC